ncbi:arylsulfatase B-like [Branchiostoma floridae]|uniref:Arylsulfatase B-like n=1 Tax=Branchiostoma floridae TaxID=7739 RepID=A0A9J7N815_BRAFL|nr:arylsulfatase B-like [Branchiostoma floridae]
MARFTLLLVLIVALAVASAFRRKKRPGKGTTSEGTTKKAQTSKPNILFIVADDLGWNDVGWHNPDVKTPNLDKLAGDGVILDNSYYNPICTPSRSSFMTGKYPYHLGTQHLVFFHMRPQGVPLEHKFLPEKLQDLGYATHMVGKWHLGFCDKKYTPTYRGFDSFYGFYEAEETYYNHSWGADPENGPWIDLRDNEEVVRNMTDEYGPDFFTTQDVKNIGDHPKDQPLFMYVPFQHVHRPLEEVPETAYRNMYRDETDNRTKLLRDMVTAMDLNVGRIVDAMKGAGLWDNTLLIFSTDNGGWPDQGGSNYPYKGGKFTLWEGGTKGVAFVHGNMLVETGYTNNEMIHAVDWFPTIVAAAGGNTDDPYEDNNLASTMKEKLLEMMEKLRQYKNDGKMVNAIFPEIDPNSLPILEENEGAWSPGWCTAIVNGDKK